MLMFMGIAAFHGIFHSTCFVTNGILKKCMLFCGWILYVHILLVTGSESSNVMHP